jgi:CubicO group peptidase (beta-lactamase class C family)
MHLRISALILAAAAACAAPPAGDQTRAGMDSERLARIPARMKAYVEKGTIAGAVTLVARRGAVAALDAAGYQDIESKKPMRTDTVFQIMSMTKPVTGVAAMILLEEGKLALGDPVEKYLPEFRGQWVVTQRGEKSLSLAKPSRPITVRDLMTHTSGMGDYPAGIADLPVKKNRTLAEAVSIVSQQPLEFEPGTKWLYSNTGLNTLGRIVEVVADKPFDQFVLDRIARPLGMKDTTFTPPPAMYDRIATVYDLKDGKLKKAEVDHYNRNSKFIRASGGLFSTASDMARFYQMMLNGGTLDGQRILSRASVEVMTALHTGDLKTGGAGAGWGLTWSVVRDAAGTLNMQSAGTYSHGGALGTYGWVDPKKDLVGVFMVQRASGGDTSERNTFVELAGTAILD